MQKYFIFNNYLQKKLIPSFINVHKAYVYTVYNKDASASQCPLVCIYLRDVCFVSFKYILRIVIIIFCWGEEKKNVSEQSHCGRIIFSQLYTLVSAWASLSLSLIQYNWFIYISDNRMSFFLLIYNTDLSYFVPIMTFIRL